MKLCCPLRSVCFIQFIQSWKQRVFFFFLFYLFGHKKKTVNEDLSLLMKMSSQKLHLDPLMYQHTKLTTAHVRAKISDAHVHVSSPTHTNTLRNTYSHRLSICIHLIRTHLSTQEHLTHTHTHTHTRQMHTVRVHVVCAALLVCQQWVLTK